MMADMDDIDPVSSVIPQAMHLTIVVHLNVVVDLYSSKHFTWDYIVIILFGNCTLLKAL